MTKDTSISTALPLEKVKKILVCQQRQIGDVLLATPSVALLQEKYPQATIDVLTEKKAVPVLENNPNIHHIWTIDKKAQASFLKQLQFYLQVVKERYDLLVDFQQLPRLRWVMALARFYKPASGLQVRLTYPPPWYNRFFYTHWVAQKTGYAAGLKAGILEALDIFWENNPPQIFLQDKEIEAARCFLREHGITGEHTLVTIDPTHRRKTRKWPEAHFSGLIQKAAELDSGLRFLLFYGPGEEAVARGIMEKTAGSACVMTDRVTDLRLMAACMSLAKLHMGNCSAPRHMAVAVGTKSLTVRGATSSGWLFPGSGHEDAALGLLCQPCNANICPLGTYTCLKDLTPEMVLPIFQRMLYGASGTEGGKDFNLSHPW